MVKNYLHLKINLQRALIFENGYIRTVYTKEKRVSLILQSKITPENISVDHLLQMSLINLYRTEHY